MSDKNKPEELNISVLNMNNYERVKPKELLQIGTKYVTNGTDNSFFTKVEDRYLGSPTAQSVIDSYVNYIVGDGLEAVTGITQEDLDRILSKKELIKLAKQFKLQGNAPIQVVYAKSGNGKIAKLYSLPARQIAVKQPPSGDITDTIEEFWFCFDWGLRGRFRPYTVPAFGYGDGQETEIYYLQAISEQPIYSLPDWFSGLQYAQMEEEISNYVINHIQNNFSAGKIVNIYKGDGQSDDAKQEARQMINNRLGGTTSAGVIITSFNKSAEDKITVDNIEITDAYRQFEYAQALSKEQIFTANKVTSPSLFGAEVSTGFSSDSEQMITALKTLYRSQINPMREQIIEGLEEILGEGVNIRFKDFKELLIGDEEIPNPNVNNKN